MEQGFAFSVLLKAETFLVLEKMNWDGHPIRSAGLGSKSVPARDTIAHGMTYSNRVAPLRFSAYETRMKAASPTKSFVLAKS